MLDQETKRRIDTARDILVGKLPNPQSQVEQITIALIYKFMDDMDKEAMEFGGESTFFTGEYEKYSWTKIFDPKLGGYEMLSLYGEAIVKLNQNPNIPQLFRDIFKNAYLPYRDPETLKMFLKIINEFHYDHSEKLGDAFEYLLSVLGSQGDAGQFRTPRHIIDFMVAIMQPQKHESICDPACGTAGFLISSYKKILNDNTLTTPRSRSGSSLNPEERKKLANNFVGYDISSEMVRLSLVNMYLHGFTTPKIYEYDSLTSTDRWGESFDIIMANPPFMTPKGGIRPHKKFAMQANRSEVLFVDYIMEHINPTTGRAAVIVPEGIIFQSANAYKTLRKLLVENNFLYGVVSLPAGIFQPYSGVKTSILLLDRTLAKKTDKILFVKIENDGYSLGAQRKELNTSDLPDATNFIKKYITAVNNNDFSLIDLENLPANSIVVEKSRIAENGDFNLSGERYRKNKNPIVSKFNMVALEEILVYEQPTSYIVESENYSDDFETPVLTAGKSFILGYTNEKNGIFDKTPVIIFDDFTTATKYVDFPFKVKSSAMKILKANENVNIKFVYHAMQKIIFDSSDHKRYWISQYSKIKIPLPPLPIQQEIVSKIEQYEKIIAGAKQVVENYKPQIEIKPEWEMVELGKVCDFIRGPFGGSLKKEIFIDKGFAVYEQSHAIYNQFEDFRYFIDEVKFKEMQRFEVYPNDIIMSCSGTMGKVAIIPNYAPKGIINQALLKLTTHKCLLPKFLKFLMGSDDFQFQLNSNVHGSAIVNIASVSTLKSIRIPLLSVELQHQIVSQIEKEQQLVNASKELIAIYQQKIKDEINKLWEE